MILCFFCGLSKPALYQFSENKSREKIIPAFHLVYLKKSKFKQSFNLNSFNRIVDNRKHNLNIELYKQPLIENTCLHFNIPDHSFVFSSR